MKALGKRIRDLRRQTGMSQEELCLRADVSMSQVPRIERGELNPSISTIYALSVGLGVEMKDMFDFRYKIVKPNIQNKLL